MKVAVYPIQSSLVYGDTVEKESKNLMESLERLTSYEFGVVSDLKDLKNADLPLILVQSGGSEGIFKEEIYPYFEGPYYLLTYGNSNSLAASLEILSFLREEHKKGEVLHGEDSYIAKRIAYLGSFKKEEKPGRLGVLGKPSDWLISSDVDYKKAREIFHIDLIDVREEEIVQAIESYKDSPVERKFESEFDPKEIQKAYSIYRAMDSLVGKYRLDGYTLRCFDILKKVHMSACLALALDNEKSVIASCEGDVPAMITAYTVLKVLGLHSFQANPQRIDVEKNRVGFAHCTLPLDMAESYHFDTHFESGIGLGIHGEMKKGDATVVKVSSSLEEFYVSEGTILENESRRDRCRTQIVIKLDSDASYFLTSPLGNHHLIVYGRHEKELCAYYRSLGLRRVI